MSGLNNIVKNTAIVLDFCVSCVASIMKSLLPEISDILFAFSAIILFVAFICVVVDIVFALRNRRI